MLTLRDPSPREMVMEEEQLGVFRSLILTESQHPTGTPIPSSTPAQAAIVIETFFRRAEDSVRILTGTLNPRVYGTDPVLVEAKKFLAVPSRTLSIVLLTSCDDDVLIRHPLLCSLRNNENLYVLEAPKELAHQFPFHFSIMDRNAYRFKKNCTSHASITAFGDQDFTARLRQIFDYIYLESTKKGF